MTIYSLANNLNYILLEKLSIISKRHNEFREQNKFKQEIINDAKKTKEEILKLKKEINNVMNFEKILTLVSNMSQYMIKSNISNKKLLILKVRIIFNRN